MSEFLFTDFKRVQEFFKGKRVAVVGSAPTGEDNKVGEIDSYDIVVRISNYGIGGGLGNRCDVFYSFFGSSTRKTKEDLLKHGVKMCMSKLPNSKPFHSEWHASRGKDEGHDYRGHFRRREGWWFCPTYIPTDERFMELFNFLGKHQSTTGFAAIWDLIHCEPSELYITGFTFMSPKKEGESILHDVDRPWRRKNSDDPIGHVPELEMGMTFKFARSMSFIRLDEWLLGKMKETEEELEYRYDIGGRF